MMITANTVLIFVQKAFNFDQLSAVFIRKWIIAYEIK